MTQNRRKRVDRTGSAPKRRSAKPQTVTDKLLEIRDSLLRASGRSEDDFCLAVDKARDEDKKASTELADDGPKLFVQCPIPEDCMLDDDHVPGGEPCWLRGDADPLQSPQHKRALRESSRAAIKAVVAKWLRMGANPGDLADHLEGARVECVALHHAKAKVNP